MARIELNEFNTKEIAALEEMDDGNAATGAVRTDETGAWIKTDDAGLAKFRDAYIPRFEDYVGKEEFAAINPRIVTLFNNLKITEEPADKISLRGVNLPQESQAQPVKVALMPIFELTDVEKSRMEIPIRWIEAYIAFQSFDNVNGLYPDTSAYDVLAGKANETDGMVHFSDIAGFENKAVAEDLHWHFLAETHYSQATLILPNGRHVRADTFIDSVSGYVNIKLTDALDELGESQVYLATTGDPFYLGVAPLGVFAKEELQAAMAGLVAILHDTNPLAYLILGEHLGR